MSDSRDRLMDSLLVEIVGGDEPPDLSKRIMSRIAGRRRWRLVAISATTLAAAATILLAVVLPGSYPAP